MISNRCITQVATAIVLALGGINASAVPLSADIATVVDESGSMYGEHTWLPGMVGDLETGLTGAGVGAGPNNNRYAQVGFGGHGWPQEPHKHQEGGSDWFGADDYENDFVTSGSFEDGWNGIDFFFDNYSARPGSALNVILVTDEDRDDQDRSLSFDGIGSTLDSNRALLNAVVNASFECEDGSRALGIDSTGTGYVADGSGGFNLCTGASATGGFGTTTADYVDLAMGVGGAAWDLNQLRAGGDTATSFTNALVDIKVQEIQQQQPHGVPAPATLALIGTGLVGLGFSRRRKADQ